MEITKHFNNWFQLCNWVHDNFKDAKLCGDTIYTTTATMKIKENKILIITEDE